MSSFLETITLASVGIIGAAIGAAASIVAVKENSSLTAKQNLDTSKKQVHQKLQGFNFYIYHMMYRYIFALFQFKYYEYLLKNQGSTQDVNRHNEAELVMWRSETHKTEIELIKAIRDLHKLLVQITYTYNEDESVKNICDALLAESTKRLSEIKFSDEELLSQNEGVFTREVANIWNDSYGKMINELLKIFNEDIEQSRIHVKQNEKSLMITSAYYWFKKEILEAWNDEW